MENNVIKTDGSSSSPSFWEREEGVQALEVVAIAAVAALLLIAFAKFGGTIWDWCKTQIQNITGISFS